MTQYQNRSTKYRLAQVAAGQETLPDLLAAKASYEGGSALLTQARTMTNNPIGRALAQRYAGICEAIEILQQR